LKVIEIVHTSIGGDLVRVQLSNTFGVQPITLGEVHIALRSKAAAIVPGSDRILTFSGKPSITMPPGAIILSDPTKLHIHPFTDLAISIYLPYPTDATTIHSVALQDNYIYARGNFAGSAIIHPVKTIQSWIFLTGVEVTASKKAGNTSSHAWKRDERELSILKESQLNGAQSEKFLILFLRIH
jgi:hypothetical protein